MTRPRVDVAVPPPSLRPRRRLLLAVLVALVVVQPGIVSAAGPVDGSYTLTINVPSDCDLSDGAGGVLHLTQGSVLPLGEVEVSQSGSNVTFTISGDALGGSISAALNFDLKIGNDDWIGHFTLLSDGGATISGETVGVCSGVTRSYGRLTGSRTSGGPAPTPTSGPLATPRDALGFQLAFETTDVLCGRSHEACSDAIDYGKDFRVAMNRDIVALDRPYGEWEPALEHLVDVVEMAARAASFQARGPCERLVPSLPITNALLPVFAKLFIQGIRQAATQQPAALEATARLADSLLLAAITADKASAARTSCSVGE